MTSYVIDASIVIHILLSQDENIVKQASFYLEKGLTQSSYLLSPAFIKVEVANVLRFKTKKTEVTKEIFDAFLELPIHCVLLSDNELKTSLTLSQEIGTTVYDTSYHLLAINRDATFLTCDKKYYEASKHLGHIKLLS